VTTFANKHFRFISMYLNKWFLFALHRYCNLHILFDLSLYFMRSQNFIQIFDYDCIYRPLNHIFSDFIHFSHILHFFIYFRIFKILYIYISVWIQWRQKISSFI